MDPGKHKLKIKWKDPGTGEKYVVKKTIRSNEPLKKVVMKTEKYTEEKCYPSLEPKRGSNTYLGTIESDNSHMHVYGLAYEHRGDKKSAVDISSYFWNGPPCTDEDTSLRYNE